MWASCGRSHVLGDFPQQCASRPAPDPVSVAYFFSRLNSDQCSLFTKTCHLFLRVKKSRFERKNHMAPRAGVSVTEDSKGTYASLAVARDVLRHLM
jgi:hypothetical protein